MKWLDRLLERVVNDRRLERVVERVISRLYARGDITVTIRHVTEKKPCAACNGSGKQPKLSGIDSAIIGKVGGSDAVRRHQMLLQGICLACSGAGE